MITTVLRGSLLLALTLFHQGGVATAGSVKEDITDTEAEAKLFLNEDAALRELQQQQPSWCRDQMSLRGTCGREGWICGYCQCLNGEWQCRREPSFTKYPAERERTTAFTGPGREFTWRENSRVTRQGQGHGGLHGGRGHDRVPGGGGQHLWRNNNNDVGYRSRRRHERICRNAQAGNFCRRRWGGKVCGDCTCNGSLNAWVCVNNRLPGGSGVEAAQVPVNTLPIDLPDSNNGDGDSDSFVAATPRTPLSDSNTPPPPDAVLYNPTKHYPDINTLPIDLPNIPGPGDSDSHQFVPHIPPASDENAGTPPPPEAVLYGPPEEQLVTVPNSCTAMASGAAAFSPYSHCEAAHNGQECIFDTSACFRWDHGQKKCVDNPWQSSCFCHSTMWMCTMPACAPCRCEHQLVEQDRMCFNVGQDCRDQKDIADCTCTNENKWSCS